MKGCRLEDHKKATWQVVSFWAHVSCTNTPLLLRSRVSNVRRWKSGHRSTHVSVPHLGVPLTCMAVRTAVPLALAEKLRHSANKVKQYHRPTERMRATREEEVSETHLAHEDRRNFPRESDQALPMEPGPQSSDSTVRGFSGDGLPLLIRPRWRRRRLRQRQSIPQPWPSSFVAPLSARRTRKRKNEKVPKLEPNLKDMRKPLQRFSGRILLPDARRVWLHRARRCKRCFRQCVGGRSAFPDLPSGVLLHARRGDFRLVTLLWGGEGLGIPHPCWTPTLAGFWTIIAADLSLLPG